MAYGDDLLNLMQMMAEQAEQRVRMMHRAWKAYEGDMPRPLIVRPGAPDDNVRLGFPSLIVDKGVSYLFGQDLPFDVDDESTGGVDAPGETPMQEYLERTWQQNKKMLTLQKLATSGGVGGHAFLKIVPPQHAGALPRLLVMDPATVFPEWDQDDIDVATKFTVQYNSFDPESGTPCVIRQITARDDVTDPTSHWTITDQVSTVGSTSWQTLRVVAWPYPWAPIVHCQNLPNPHAFWGLADLEEPVLHACDVINRLLSNLNKIIRLHGSPILYTKGMTQAQASTIDIAPDRLLTLPNPQAEIAQVEMASDLSSFLRTYEELKEALFQIARTPEIALGKLDNLGQISGVALRVMYAPLVEKTNVKRLTYGYLLEELNAHLLELGGFGAGRHVTNRWPEIVPSDAGDEAKTALLKKQIGVSTDTLLQELGYDPDEEMRKAQEEDQQAGNVGDALLSRFDRAPASTDGAVPPDAPQGSTESGGRNYNPAA